MKNDNPTSILIRFIDELEIPVTRKSIHGELQIHPEFNSLLAFSEILDNWKVPNAACSVSFEQIENLPLPFITLLSTKQFCVVTQIDKNQVVLSTDHLTNKIFSIEEFKKLYSGSVLIAKKEANSGETDYVQKRRKEFINDWRIPVGITFSVIILLGFLLLDSSYLTDIN